MKFTGTIGNNIRSGTNANDSFFYGQRGGNDKLKGLGGNDTFNLGAKFNALDAIDGGTGNDTLTLDGNYVAGVVFGATTLVNVETIIIAAGHSYKLTTHDKTVAAGKTLTVDAHALGAADVLTFSGVHETNGHFAIVAGAGNDVLTGGWQSNSFDLTHGGNDTATGGAGNDTFNLGATLTAADRINGGAGSNDVVMLAGDYHSGVTLSATTLLNVERIVLADSGFDYQFTTDQATVGAGQRLTVDGSALSAGHRLLFSVAGDENDGGLSRSPRSAGTTSSTWVRPSTPRTGSTAGPGSTTTSSSPATTPGA